jgi:hypothetical protein
MLFLWKQLVPKNSFLILCRMHGGAGCMAALDAEHYLQEVGAQEGKAD